MMAAGCACQLAALDRLPSVYDIGFPAQRRVRYSRLPYHTEEERIGVLLGDGISDFVEVYTGSTGI